MKTKSVLMQLFSLCLLLGIATSAQADIQGKIIGGTIAPANKYPSTVAILFKDNFDLIVSGNALDNNDDPVPETDAHFQSQFCAGTLIDAEWVLTAAHCMIDFVPGELLILEGTQTLEITDVNALPGNRITVTDIIRHPNYDAESFDSDLALLKLSAPATQTTSAIFTGSLAATQISASATECTTENCASIVGWGTDDAVNGNTFPLSLLEAQVPLVDNLSCDQDLGGGITSNMFCAGFELGGKDTCQGDSGGPLFMRDAGETSPTDYEIAGITSFGNGCANPDSPGAYTNVVVFQSYINGFVSGTVAATDVPVITTTQTNYSGFLSQNLPVVITTISATDGDNDILNWSIEDGQRAGDVSFFNIDSNGNLTLTSVPNPPNNDYEILVKVSDGQDGSDFLRLNINLNDSALMTTVTNTTNSDGTVTLLISLLDANGNPLPTGGETVVVSATGSTTVSAVTDNGDGTYSVTLTNSTGGTSDISATINGQSAGVIVSGLSVPGNPVVVTPDPNSGGGGGSMGWLLLPLLGLAWRRHK